MITNFFVGEPKLEILYLLLIPINQGSRSVCLSDVLISENRNDRFGF